MLYNKNWDKKPNPISTLLNKAADLLVQTGHTKWTLIDSQGQMCANGAIYFAAESRHLDFYAGADALASYLKLGDRRQIPAWNNAPERTGEEVIDAFRQAAKAMETADAI
jgi:hypothetical protein